VIPGWRSGNEPAAVDLKATAFAFLAPVALQNEPEKSVFSGRMALPAAPNFLAALPDLVTLEVLWRHCRRRRSGVNPLDCRVLATSFHNSSPISEQRNWAASTGTESNYAKTRCGEMPRPIL